MRQQPIPTALHEIRRPEADACQLKAVLGSPGQAEGRVVGRVDHDGDREQGQDPQLALGQAPAGPVDILRGASGTPQSIALPIRIAQPRRLKNCT